MTTLTAPSVAAVAAKAATAIQKDVAFAYPKENKNNPPIVSPRPNLKEQSATAAAVASSSRSSSVSSSIAKSRTAAAPAAAAPVTVPKKKPKPWCSLVKPKKEKKETKTKAKHPRHSKKAMPVSKKNQKEILPCLGDHGESTISGSNRVVAKQPQSILSSSSSAPLSASASASASFVSPSRPRPPLISRYCGCCGDILSTKAYGFDEQGRDRRALYEQRNTATNNCNPINRNKLLEAAESVKQALAKGKHKKSTKASRAKMKRAKKSYWHPEINHQHHLHKDIAPWPEESLQMDMTIIEGLISLKNTPKDEVDCSCWKQGAGKKLSSVYNSDNLRFPPKTKKHKAATKLLSSNTKSSSSKTKIAASRKKSLAKGANSITASNAAEVVVSTKTVITKCPKTGKKIKKTVRVVKKLVKKKQKRSPLSIHSSNGKLFTAATTATKGAVTLADATPKKVRSLGPTTTLGKEPTASATTTTTTTTTPKQQPTHPWMFAGSNSGSSSKTHGSNNKKREHFMEDEDSCSDDGGFSDAEGNSTKKRRRNDEKADPDLRERLMNCPLKDGVLFPSQQELMELTTIRKRNALQTFYKRFNELRQFIALFGDGELQY